MRAAFVPCGLVPHALMRVRAPLGRHDDGPPDIELLEDFLIAYRLIMPSRDLLNLLFKVYDTFETKSLVLPK